MVRLRKLVGWSQKWSQFGVKNNSLIVPIKMKISELPKTNPKANALRISETGSRLLKPRPLPVDCLGLTKRWSLYVGSHGKSRGWGSPGGCPEKPRDRARTPLN